MPLDIASRGTVLEGRSPEALALLQRIGSEYPRAALASSFGAEDMVLTDLLARHRLPGRVGLQLAQPVFADRYVDHRATGSFILIDEVSNNTVAAGMIQ